MSTDNCLPFVSVKPLHFLFFVQTLQSSTVKEVVDPSADDDLAVVAEVSQ